MPSVRRAIAGVLRREGHEVEEVGDGATALARLEAERFDLLVTDVLMPGLDGSEVLMRLRSRSDRPRTLAISGGAGGMSGQEALRLATELADASLPKPFERAELVAAVEGALR